MDQTAKGQTMKRAGRLYPQIVSYENIHAAARNAQRCKRYRSDVLEFNFNLEQNLIGIQEELSSLAYRPGPYKSFVIYEPKRRYISAAPYRDRVVHHALCNIIEPVFDRAFVESSYANRRGKGTLKALEHFVSLARRYRYCLRADIEKYFPSIDHRILFEIIQRKIKCRHTLSLIEKIIAHSNEQEPVVHHFPGDSLFTPYERRHGLPIGNLTSQLWANVYLDELDHAMVGLVKGRRYIRYVDDFAIFSDDHAQLVDARNFLSEALSAVRLRLHPVKTYICESCVGVNFLGFRIFPEKIRIRQENLKRARRRFRELQREFRLGRLSGEKAFNSIQSWISHVSFADSWRLREDLFGSLVFSRS